MSAPLPCGRLSLSTPGTARSAYSASRPSTCCCSTSLWISGTQYREISMTHIDNTQGHGLAAPTGGYAGAPTGQHRGSLRIYLGAAAGVGKTFDMLGEGHRRQSRGTDVVVAYVETHGRRRTGEQLAGLDVMPRATIRYRGSAFEEMDVDAVIARHPQIALVDELAHTNVPGSRNEKRWQDVEELLTAGIAGITTVNIQHLESLNDVVLKIT